jgi:hypothetical protein
MAQGGDAVRAMAADEVKDDRVQQHQAQQRGDGDCGDVAGVGALRDVTAGRKGGETPAPRVDNPPAQTPTGSPTAPGDPSDSGAPAG